MVAEVIQTVLGGAIGIAGGLFDRTPSPHDFAMKRGIHNKSFLEFHFPNKLVARLPFYENIDITESKQANLVTYDPIGRSSSLYSYAGASSRALKLSFFLTLPHIYGMHVGSKVRFTPESLDIHTREQVRKQMTHDPTMPEMQPWSGEMQDAVAEDPFILEEFQMDLEDAEVADLLASKFPKELEPKTFTQYVAWWVNLIRSSVLNNQQNLMEGPPVVRLTHGMLYQNIPCICKSYNLSYEPAGGMDRDTLLSRRIKVNMNLEEFRAGNFGEFKGSSEHLLDRDNAAGWEAIIEIQTTDPGFTLLEGLE